MYNPIINPVKKSRGVVFLNHQKPGVVALVPKVIPVQFEFAMCEQFPDPIEIALESTVHRRMSTGNPPQFRP